MIDLDMGNYVFYVYGSYFAFFAGLFGLIAFSLKDYWRQKSDWQSYNSTITPDNAPK